MISPLFVLEDPAADPHEIADVEIVKILIFLVTKGIPAEVDLNFARAVSQVQESRFTHRALGRDAASDTHLSALCATFFLLLEKSNCLLDGVSS